MNILNNNALGATNTATALQNANMDWTVSKENIYTASGDIIPNQFRTVRSDNDFTLGIVGNKYEIIQTADAFGLCDDLIAADPALKFSTIGQLSGGRQVFASVDLNKPFDVVPGDTHFNRLLVKTSHDGSKSFNVSLLTLRLVCTNGMTRTLKTDASANIRHTATSFDRLSVARRELTKTAYTMNDLKDKLQTLAARQVTRESISNILDRLFPIPNASENGASVTRTENKRAMFLELFERNDGNKGFSLIKGTAYNAFNAFTEYTDHYAVAKTTAGKTGQSVNDIRTENAFFGAGAIAKNNALEIILEATQYAPAKVQPTVIYPLVNNASVLDAILNAN